MPEYGGRVVEVYRLKSNNNVQVFWEMPLQKWHIRLGIDSGHFEDIGYVREMFLSEKYSIGPSRYGRNNLNLTAHASTRIFVVVEYGDIISSRYLMDLKAAEEKGFEVDMSKVEEI